MRAGLARLEPEVMARWQRIGIYDRLREKTGRDRFILHDGPPYANGNLHIGHALNKVLKDMVVRSQQMMGKDACYVPGWDCHGLPIEWKIEETYRARGQNKDSVDVVAFRRECRRFAEHWVDVQRTQFQRLGIGGAWETPYLTMDFHAEAVIAEEFMKFLMSGVLYQGSKPVMWSPVEKTALAEAEVEYLERESLTIWAKFRAVAPDRGDLDGAFVVIWTTTPWTIPSNKAVVFGRDIAYGLYEITAPGITAPGITAREITAAALPSQARPGDRYILADAQAGEVLRQAQLQEGQYRRLRSVGADELETLSLFHPLAGVAGSNGAWSAPRDFLAADFVSDSEGTGFVHCAPSHGLEEYELFRALGRLEDVLTYNVQDDGSFRPDLPLFGGRQILRPDGREGDANAAVIDALAQAGGLLARGKIRHSYPHSWRSKAPVIYRNTPQWFAALDTAAGGNDTHGTTIRERALHSIETLVKWTPPGGKNRLHAMIATRPDWVLSRQRAWGVPLTCFTRRGRTPADKDFLLKNSAVNARILAAFRAQGADAWFDKNAKQRFLQGLADPDDYDMVPDILDVWFDSGSTHAFVLRDRADGSKDGIADLYLEGTDQHRGWFQSSLLQACGTQGRAPYRGVLTHGFTMDESGRKMSKSVGNTVAPERIIKQFGADILRLWVAQSDYTADLRIGSEILKGASESYRRLRNTIRYLLGALGTAEGTRLTPPQELPPLERWILHRLAQLDETTRQGYAAYDFQGVFSALFHFATLDLSAFYFDIRKDVLYCDGDTPRRQAMLWVMAQVFDRLVAWLAPILVFTMEQAWLQRYPGAESSVHLRDFPSTPPEWRDDTLAEQWHILRQVRRVITTALEQQRTAGGIGASLEAAPVVYLRDDAVREVVQSVALEDLCITSGISVRAGPIPEEAFELPSVPNVGVVFARAIGSKCLRCWKILPDVGQHAYPGTCQRCNAVLASQRFGQNTP